MKCQNKSYEICEICSHRENCDQRVIEPTRTCEKRSAVECHFCLSKYYCDQKIETYCKNPCYSLCKDCREQGCPKRIFEPGFKDKLKAIAKALIILTSLLIAIFLVYYCASIILVSSLGHIFFDIFVVIVILMIALHRYNNR